MSTLIDSMNPDELKRSNHIRMYKFETKDKISDLKMVNNLNYLQENFA